MWLVYILQTKKQSLIMPPEVYSEPYQTSKMEHFVKIVNDWKTLTIFAKCPSSIFDRVLNTPLVASSKIAFLSVKCTQVTWSGKRSLQLLSLNFVHFWQKFQGHTICKSCFLVAHTQIFFKNDFWPTLTEVLSHHHSLILKPEWKIFIHIKFYYMPVYYFSFSWRKYKLLKYG